MNDHNVLYHEIQGGFLGQEPEIVRHYAVSVHDLFGTGISNCKAKLFWYNMLVGYHLDPCCQC